MCLFVANSFLTFGLQIAYQDQRARGPSIPKAGMYSLCNLFLSQCHQEEKTLFGLSAVEADAARSLISNKQVAGVDPSSV